MSNIDINSLPEPFLGRLLIETIKDEAQTLLKKRLAGDTALQGKVSKEFLESLEIPDTEVRIDERTGQSKTVLSKRNVPISKGKILKMAPDAFGDYFKSRYGDVGYTPTVGDTVIFIPNESSRLEPTDTYHVVNDCDVQAYIKATVIENSKTKDKEVIE